MPTTTMPGEAVARISEGGIYLTGWGFILLILFLIAVFVVGAVVTVK